MQVTESSDLPTWDANGIAWGVDRETGEGTGAAAVVVAYFESSDCSGTAWTPGPIPRFSVYGYAEGMADLLAAPFVVRPDPLDAEVFCATSLQAVTETIANELPPSDDVDTLWLPRWLG